MKFQFQCPQSFIAIQSCSFMSLSMAVSKLQQQTIVVATETLSSAKPKYLLSGPLQKKFANL